MSILCDETPRLPYLETTKPWEVSDVTSDGPVPAFSVSDSPVCAHDTQLSRLNLRLGGWVGSPRGRGRLTSEVAVGVGGGGVFPETILDLYIRAGSASRRVPDPRPRMPAAPGVRGHVPMMRITLRIRRRSGGRRLAGPPARVGARSPYTSGSGNTGKRYRATARRALARSCRGRMQFDSRLLNSTSLAFLAITAISQHPR